MGRGLNTELQTRMRTEAPLNALTPPKETGFRLSPSFIRRFDMPLGMG